MAIHISEKQLEDVFEIYHEILLEPGLELLSRQHIFKNGRRADLIFVDKNQRKVVIELKRNAVTRSDIGQLIEYRGIMDAENPRVVLAAPIIPLSIKKAFDHFGIEYLEFSLPEMEKLLHSLPIVSLGENPKQIINNLEEIISEPLSNRKVIDGNVAFKVAYVDNNWADVCSPNVADYNFKNRTWCNIQKDFEHNCQSAFWKDNLVSLEASPCHDCIALKELCFYPGHNHGPKTNNEPRRMLNAKQGKIAVFTSVNPGDREDQRFIFAVAEIAEFLDVEEDGKSYEMVLGNFEKAIAFDEGNRPLFWNYYRNSNAPDRKAWNTGLFRYMNDRMLYELLQDIKVNWNSGEGNDDICDYLLKKVD